MDAKGVRRSDRRGIPVGRRAVVCVASSARPLSFGDRASGRERSQNRPNARHPRRAGVSHSVVCATGAAVKDHCRCSFWPGRLVRFDDVRIRAPANRDHADPAAPRDGRIPGGGPVKRRDHSALADRYRYHRPASSPLRIARCPTMPAAARCRSPPREDLARTGVAAIRHRYGRSKLHRESSGSICRASRRHY
jgi:hypothetical protein